MFQRIVDNQERSSLANELRRKRFSLFKRLLSRLEGRIRILDIGGTQSYWEQMGFPSTDEVCITVLNITKPTGSIPGFTNTVGDARDIQFDNMGFDVVFSNSVLEHVGDYEDQRRMAEEVKRVGKRYFIQTPNKYFPIEPHFLFPFFQFLPLSVRVWMVRQFNMGWYRRISDYKEARELVESVRLLKKGELIALFPDATIIPEKFMGMTKSYMVFAGWR